MKQQHFYLVPVLTLLAAPASWGQQNQAGTRPAATPAQQLPRPDQLEPGVDTSATPPSSTASEVSPPQAPPTPPSSNTQATTTSQAKRSPPSAAPAQPGTASQAAPNANTGASKSAQASPAAQPKAGSGKAQDRLELDTTDITGNRELPKVLYIVPWKRSDLGDLVGRPSNSLLDEVLAPVDRDVFKRENRYYQALKPDAAAAAAAGASAPASAAGVAPGGGGKP